MAITRLSQGLAFDPAAIQVMTAAYDSACRSLGLKGMPIRSTKLLRRKSLQSPKKENAIPRKYTPES